MSEKSSLAFATFETALGHCAIAWSEDGIQRFILPEKTREHTVARVRRLVGEAKEAAPPKRVLAAVERIGRQLAGGGSKLESAPLDLSGVSPFAQAVYRALMGVPAGETITYGELAERAGSKGAARAVGRAMASNPLPVLIPCHRVVGANGKPGGFTAYGGLATKARLLALEGVTLARGASEPSLPYDAKRALRVLRRADRQLATLIQRVGPFRLQLEKAPSTFVSLARAIVYQQLTGAAAATIYRRLGELFPRRRSLRAEDVAGTSVEQLRSVGLSGAKAAALRDLADKTLAGAVPPLAALARMDDADIISTLTSVRGVGPWTVEMLLIFRLGRPDVLPLGDYAVRKGFSLAFGLDEVASPKQVAERGERWRPYRSVASWYLWRALEL